MNNNRKTKTTLGNLIVALTDEVSGCVRDEKKAYEVVAFMLARLLKNNGASNRRGLRHY